MGKKKKFNILTDFFISHKSDVKTFLKLILNECLKAWPFNYLIIILTIFLMCESVLPLTTWELTVEMRHF